jgi:hypothetical protein
MVSDVVIVATSTERSDTMLTIVLTGKQGPAFGDRPSATHIEVAEYYSNVKNWASAERSDALRAAFARIVDEDIQVQS